MTLDSVAVAINPSFFKLALILNYSPPKKDLAREVPTSKILPPKIAVWKMFAVTPGSAFSHA